MKLLTALTISGILVGTAHAAPVPNMSPIPRADPLITRVACAPNRVGIRAKNAKACYANCKQWSDNPGCYRWCDQNCDN